MSASKPTDVGRGIAVGRRAPGLRRTALPPLSRISLGASEMKVVKEVADA